MNHFIHPLFGDRNLMADCATAKEALHTNELGCFSVVVGSMITHFVVNYKRI